MECHLHLWSIICTSMDCHVYLNMTCMYAYIYGMLCIYMERGVFLTFMEYFVCLTSIECYIYLYGMSCISMEYYLYLYGMSCISEYDLVVYVYL